MPLELIIAMEMFIVTIGAIELPLGPCAPMSSPTKQLSKNGKTSEICLAFLWEK